MSALDTESRIDEPHSLIARERLAILVILIAFATFVLLLTSTLLLGRWYFTTASIAQLAAAQGTSGKTLLELPGSDVPSAIEAGRTKPDLGEGSTLRTDADSQLLLTFYDGSSLTIFPNSTVVLNTMRRPRFGRSDQPNRLVVTLEAGRVRAKVARERERPMHVEIQTRQAHPPHGGIVLEEGSYAIEASNPVTHVSVREGEARVSGQNGQAVTLRNNERAEIPLGAAAVGPLPAKRNLLLNSGFSNPEVATATSNGPLVEGWTASSDQGGDGGTVDGTVEELFVGASRALHFRRADSANNHGETGVSQTLDALVEDYLSLLLRFDVRIAWQSLGGGGEQSSEYPMMVRVDYIDQNGDPQHWTHGFYYQNEPGFNVIQGTEIPQDVWHTFEIDLYEVLEAPRLITRLRFYASGWDWESYIRDPELIAE